MDRLDGGLWRTLARIYTVVVACGICVPVTAAIPTLAGFGSFFPTLLFGAVGVGLAGSVTYAVDARLDTVSARRLFPDAVPPEQDDEARASVAHE